MRQPPPCESHSPLVPHASRRLPTPFTVPTRIEDPGDYALINGPFPLGENTEVTMNSVPQRKTCLNFNSCNEQSQSSQIHVGFNQVYF